MADTVRCKCGKVAEVEALVQAYGYRCSYVCVCESRVRVEFEERQKPRYLIDYAALDALPEKVREAAIAYGEVPMTKDLPFGVEIDEHTPVWAW